VEDRSCYRYNVRGLVITICGVAFVALVTCQFGRVPRQEVGPTSISSAGPELLPVSVEISSGASAIMSWALFVAAMARARLEKKEARPRV
jgi:hypothetical protein